MGITIGIKLPVGEVSASACMSIKSMTGLPLREIKKRALNNEYIFECAVADEDGLKLINKIKREMKKLGIVTRLFEDGREEAPELFDNLEQMYDELNRNYY